MLVSLLELSLVYLSNTVSTKAIRTLDSLPTPEGEWLLGHLRPFRAGPKHLVLERWAEECGDLFCIRLGTDRFLVSTNPDINGEILKRRPEEFRRHPKITEILEEMGVLAVFNAEGDQWRQYRRPTAEALNLRKVRSFYPTLIRKSDQLLQVANGYADVGAPVDMSALLRRFTTDVTTVIAFGYELNTLSGKEDALQECMEMIFPMVNQRMSAPLPLWRWWESKQDKQFGQALKTLRDTIVHFISVAQDRLESDPSLLDKPSNFLEALLTLEEDAALSEEEIYSAVFTLLMAGEDTTANSLAWVMYYLALHPEHVNKVRDEARQVYPNTRTPNNIKEHQQLEYAQAVAEEAIRLKPTSPQLILQAQAEVVIGNVRIPAGTNVILQNRVAQVSPEYFTDPDQFQPERWSTKKCPVHSPEVVRAFGAGPRYCPGKHLALHEMVIVISSLCRQFDFEMLGNPQEITEEFSFTMHPSKFELKLIPQ